MWALAAFVVLAFTFSWTLYWAASPEGGPAADGLRMLASFGPSFAALGVVARNDGRAGVRRLVRSLVHWRISPRWYVGSLVGPPLVMGAGAGVYVITGGSLGPTEHDPGMWWAIPLIFGVVLVVGGPLGEELGWRGFALPRLQQVLGPVPATSLLAVVWALWHLPQLTSPGSVQHEVPWLLFLGQMIVMSLFYTWLVNRTASLVPALLLHTSFNTSVGLLPVLPSATGPAGPAVISLVLAVSAAGILLFRTRGNLGMPAEVR